MHDVRESVWAWMGLTRAELYAKLIETAPDTCAVCGKPAPRHYTLCPAHRAAFHRWQRGPRLELKVLGWALSEYPLAYQDLRDEYKMSRSRTERLFAGLRRRGLMRNSGSEGVKAWAGAHWLTEKGRAFAEDLGLGEE